MSRRWGRWVAFVAAVMMMLTLSLGTAAAQSRRSGRHGKSAQVTKKAKKTAKAKKRRGRGAAAEGESADHGAAGESERSVPSSSRNAITDREQGMAGGREVTEAGGEKVKVMEFTGLDVSGRLKSPQILYFLNRMRAEFDRPRLDHRSFMPELVRSAKEKSF